MTKKEMLKAIKDKCLDCACGNTSEIIHCPIPTCSLYNLRGGKDRTHIKRIISDKQLDHMKKMRDSRMCSKRHIEDNQTI